MITFNGKNSDEFYLQSEGGMTFVSPSRNIEYIHIDGKDGEIATGDGMLKNINQGFPFRVRCPVGTNIRKLSSDISNWLKKDNLWHDFLDSSDKDFIYRAMYVDEYELERLLFRNGKLVLTFVLKPYKYLKTGLNELSNPSYVDNPFDRLSKPKITIKGTGNITLTIGNQTINLKGVDGGVIIDSLYDTVSNLDGTSAWTKITTYPLPKISKGRQNIITTGTVTDIKIVPRWEMIV